MPEIVRIPIREGVIISVQMPVNITRSEAQKIANVIAALATKPIN